jgi:ABC-2 type transport system permease protein
MLIFKRELRAHRKSLILWSAAILLVIVSALGKYSTAVASGQSINALFDQIPEAIKAVLGMGNFDLSTISGFYGMCYLYLALLAAVHAVLLGANIIAKEERDKTTEFLLVKPFQATNPYLKAVGRDGEHRSIQSHNLIFSVILVAQFSKGENITVKSFF